MVQISSYPNNTICSYNTAYTYTYNIARQLPILNYTVRYNTLYNTI